MLHIELGQLRANRTKHAQRKHASLTLIMRDYSSTMAAQPTRPTPVPILRVWKSVASPAYCISISIPNYNYKFIYSSHVRCQTCGFSIVIALIYTFFNPLTDVCFTVTTFMKEHFCHADVCIIFMPRYNGCSLASYRNLLVYSFSRCSRCFIHLKYSPEDVLQ